MTTENINAFVAAALASNGGLTPKMKAAIAALTPAEIVDAVTALGARKEPPRVLPLLPVWFGATGKALDGLKLGQIKSEALPIAFAKGDDVPSRAWCEAALVCALAHAGPDNAGVVKAHAKARFAEYAGKAKSADDEDAAAVRRLGLAAAAAVARPGAIKLLAQFGADGVTETTIRDVIAAMVAAGEAQK